ncbi:hypothetical protein [Alteromonas oceanisediminis]|uniref:hypothetical protein n=1 Tax=Alteromonas oceanisediminis TaxID=2836180 RepID=UPI001BDA0E5C|nr:hypothetical protein [Alteromonas oceanisediminis]MBT0586612.1 hypothetical protein [Alteromonas oceanisediminis]
MSNPNDHDDLPLIKLDEEDRRGHRTPQSTTPAGKKTVRASQQQDAPQPTAKGGNGLAVFALLLAIGSAGAAGWLFYQLEQQMAVAQGAEIRIKELENKLSATGEEIGESTVALQVKVTELTNKTNELWEQMDKLWASAWRRNQEEIGQLNSKVDDQVASIKSNLSSTTATAKDNVSSIADTRGQVENLVSEVLSLNVQLERAAATNGSARRDLQAATEKLTLLEQRNASLVTRVNQLENEIRQIATRVASSAGGTP